MSRSECRSALQFIIDDISMFFFRRQLSILGMMLWASFSAGAAPAAKWNAQWEPVKLVNGSPVLFRVRAPLRLSELQGNFLGQEFAFRSSQACHCWYGFAGVNLGTKPGTYTLRVEGKGTGGKETAMTYLVRVSAAHYPTSAIKVAPAFVEPPKEAEPVIAAADTAKKQAFATTDPNSLWSGAFEPPTQTETSGVFGSSRTYNGVKKSQHLGLDFRASTWYARARDECGHGDTGPSALFRRKLHHAGPRPGLADNLHAPL